MSFVVIVVNVAQLEVLAVVALSKSLALVALATIELATVTGMTEVMVAVFPVDVYGSGASGDALSVALSEFLALVMLATIALTLQWRKRG